VARNLVNGYGAALATAGFFTQARRIVTAAIS
jgi:hypothetical protein